jgi:hypothetical protein
VKAQLTVPNVLTVARIAMVAIAGWLCFVAATHEALAVSLLIAAAVLDVFDGWYARRFSRTTALGKHLDPFADKVLVAVVLVWLGMDAGSITVWCLVGVFPRSRSGHDAVSHVQCAAPGEADSGQRIGQAQDVPPVLGRAHDAGDRPFPGEDGPGPVRDRRAGGMLVVSLWAMAGYIKAKGPAADHEQTHFALRSPG